MRSGDHLSPMVVCHRAGEDPVVTDIGSTHQSPNEVMEDNIFQIERVTAFEHSLRLYHRK